MQRIWIILLFVILCYLRGQGAEHEALNITCNNLKETGARWKKDFSNLNYNGINYKIFDNIHNNMRQELQQYIDDFKNFVHTERRDSLINKRNYALAHINLLCKEKVEVGFDLSFINKGKQPIFLSGSSSNNELVNLLNNYNANNHKNINIMQHTEARYDLVVKLSELLACIGVKSSPIKYEEMGGDLTLKKGNNIVSSIKCIDDTLRTERQKYINSNSKLVEALGKAKSLAEQGEEEYATNIQVAISNLNGDIRNILGKIQKSSEKIYNLCNKYTDSEQWLRYFLWINVESLYNHMRDQLKEEFANYSTVVLNICSYHDVCPRCSYTWFVESYIAYNNKCNNIINSDKSVSFFERFNALRWKDGYPNMYFVVLCSSIDSTNDCKVNRYECGHDGNENNIILPDSLPFIFCKMPLGNMRPLPYKLPYDAPESSIAGNLYPQYFPSTQLPQ